MERYEWVVIRHPELASSIKTQAQEDTASSEGQDAENNSLQQPEKPAGDLSPFLSARHFNLNSKNTSMFMAGNFDSIIIGEWIITVFGNSCLFLCGVCLLDWWKSVTLQVQWSGVMWEHIKYWILVSTLHHI